MRFFNQSRRLPQGRQDVAITWSRLPGRSATRGSPFHGSVAAGLLRANAGFVNQRMAGEVNLEPGSVEVFPLERKDRDQAIHDRPSAGYVTVPGPHLGADIVDDLDSHARERARKRRLKPG